MQVTAPANELTDTYGISTDAILPQAIVIPVLAINVQTFTCKTTL